MKILRRPGFLHFDQGVSFSGELIFSEEQESKLEHGIWGESAFTTAMTGYEETLTDPSYLGQHIIFSSSHIGNYPPCKQRQQSKTIHAVSAIARNFTEVDFLLNNGTPLFHQLDTRSLVRFLTKFPDHKSILTTSKTAPSADKFQNTKLFCHDLKKVSQNKAEIHKEGKRPIVLINYGVKKSILENLEKLNIPLVSLPFDSSLEEILSFEPGLVFLSNGPGDPRKYKEQIAVIKNLINKQIPLRGICLGHQLISLALGAKAYKLPFGHRGLNHPVIDLESGKFIITSQNHGYAIDDTFFKGSISKTIQPHYRSLFDQSIEGITSINHKIKTVQFHPEASPGPQDALGFFDEIKQYLNGENERPNPVSFSSFHEIPKGNDFIRKKEIHYKKILIIGSGPIKIGQASEFDYSGTQACRALKEVGLQVYLLNSNPATIMTDKDLSYKTFIEPITKENIKKIIINEQIDAVLSTMGGQTALNLCLELEKEEFFLKNHVELLGAKAETIEKTEDRNLFSKELDKLGYKTGTRKIVQGLSEAKEVISKKLNYPVIIRQSFALGGKGATFVNSESHLEHVILKENISFPLTLEKSLIGQKEVELEVMVDKQQNGVIVCSIENIDPCGVHTGDSITVAPAQTISDNCFQKMRTMALNIAKHMGVVAGGANVQFAINPQDENDITVIEMNPRVSRSSALASKATGYAIAKISALLAIGYTLTEINNDITKVSPVSFEPTQDYVAIKIPLFPFNKFPKADTTLGPQMRSVGEVLALGSTFNEAFFKALRSCERGLEIPSLYQLPDTPHEINEDYLIDRLKLGKELSLLTALQALRKGISKRQISKISNITPWFVEQIYEFYKIEEKLKMMRENSSAKEFQALFHQAKLMGFSDKFLGKILNRREKDILTYRTNENIKPVYKAVDTCSGEFFAFTPYYYSTYQKENETTLLKKDSYIIFGSGPNRIGQGIEFDYSCVKACEGIKDFDAHPIMINSNPETVSTDYDTSDRLFLAPLYNEDVHDILCNERPKGIISCFSGQTGILLREELEKGFRLKNNQANFLGSKLKVLEITEDRKKFSKLLQGFPIAKTKSKEVHGYQELVDAMIDIGFPIIIRPSYVIGGESMFIFHGHEDIHNLPEKIKKELSRGHSKFLVESYLEQAIEYDIDLIRDKNGHCIFVACEHTEFAGVHSGDSGMITPPVHLTRDMYCKLKNVSMAIADKLDIIGPINIQFAIKDKQIYCIEANPRGSRTLPFLSKAYDLSLPNFAVKAMLGGDIPNFDCETMKYFCVKQSTFPFDRFPNDSTILGPKMLSTGETMGVDTNKDQAILKSYLGNFPGMKEKGKILLSLTDKNKTELISYYKMLYHSGYTFYATKGTSQFILKQGIPCEEVCKINEKDETQESSKKLCILDILQDRELRMVFNTPSREISSKGDGHIIRQAAIQNSIPCFTRIENIKAVIESLIFGQTTYLKPLALQELPFERT